MSVSCGIVGLPRVGKTTIYNALTAAQAEAGGFSASKEPNVAMLEVPDPNLELIASYIPTKKLVPATVKIVDIVGLQEGASRGEGVGNRFLAHIRETDAILHVVQCFTSANVAREGPLDPKRDIEVLELELAMADIETLGRVLDRVAKKAKSGAKDAILEKEVAERAKDALERGERIARLEWKKSELDALRPLCLLSMKPVLYVANVGDDDIAGNGPHARAVGEHAESVGARWLALCGDLESELRRMPPEDRPTFMAEYGMTELALPRLLREAYSLLGLQTFYTAGEKEVRAWTVHAGDTAPVAAGKIHTDFQKSFIRLEVYGVQDLVQHRTEAGIRAAGRMRTEGRDYVMREEDVCHFLVGK